MTEEIVFRSKINGLEIIHATNVPCTKDCYYLTDGTLSENIIFYGVSIEGENFGFARNGSLTVANDTRGFLLGLNITLHKRKNQD